MRHLVSNIINKPMPSLPAQFTIELRHLVQAMLAKKHRDRPSVNTILTMPVFRAKISDILEDNIKQVSLRVNSVVVSAGVMLWLLL